MPAKSKSADSDRKPVKVFRLGNVSASVFAREVSGDYGTRTFHSVNIQQRYSDGDEVKFTSSIDLGELPQALRFLQLGQAFVEEQEASVEINN